MCGIIARYSKKEGSGVDIGNLSLMLDKLNHRGPDEDGLCRCEDLHLGHKRLSIIGPQHGHQPIPNETEDIQVIANGEIYNYRELKESLAHHSFSTHSDSEVIVHLYEEMGYRCVQKLEGMFAFVLSERGKPFAARDTLGIKPLYYLENKEEVYFASEMKSLSDLSGDVKEFPPGHFYTLETGVQPFHRLEVPYSLTEKYQDYPLEKILKGIRDRLERAVIKRLMSDVPLGVLLSGGLDSSLVSALARKHTGGQQLNSFVVGMEGGSDLLASRRVAEYLGTVHHQYIYTAEELLEALPRVIYFLESFDPSLVRSAIPTYFVCRLASQQVKVVLSGEGADELFSGYSYLKAIPSPEKLHRELVRSINALHNINLQRLDRMSMAFSIEGRVPFLDLGLVEYAASLPPNIKLYGDKQREKWILRKAFEGFLPDDILWRDKEQFAEGCGSDTLIQDLVANQISDAEFERDRMQLNPPARSKEELYYYRIFREFYQGDSTAASVGRWATA